MSLKILHLSDLHISSKEDSNHKILRNNIIKYIRDNNIKIDAIVFTGDIIDRNDKSAYVLSVEFFNELLKACDLPTERLLIVPGNHDMERDEVINGILDSEKMISDKYIEQSWKYVCRRMGDYSEFVKELGIADVTNIEDGYGIRVIELDGKKICFNMINSAWSNKGNSDYRNLYVGRWQLEKNREELFGIVDKDLVITMMHHPLSWLIDDEAEMLREYMCHEEKFNSHILLHGHIHDAKAQAEVTPGGGFISLTTGIGYPKMDEREAGQPKICECRFSIYGIDVENQLVDNFCLKSTSHGNFVPDTGLYKGSEDGHYSLSWGENQKSKKEAQENECMELDPVPVINCWSGRTEELELLSKENTNVIAISGVGGQGKTALAAKFMRETPETVKKFNKKLWVDCRELPNTMHVKLLSLLERLTGGAESATVYRDEQLSDTIKRFFKHISEERVLIVFDNVDAYVNLESEELVGELSEFIEIALTQQHSSLLIMTCRVPIYDSRANFRTIKLDGLKEPEGIVFFKNRGVKLESIEDENACKQIIRITKGHPWWLGLIAGQMVSTKVSPKEYLEENREGILARDSQVEKFFGAIWQNLNTGTGRVAQNIIRYLAESTRPLSINDLSILLGDNFKNTNKAVKMLMNLSLLIAHGENCAQGKSYQVHPLVREFIHKNYDKTIQKPFVDKLVELIMGSRLYTIIFINTPSAFDQPTGQCNPRDIIDSIDTCLTSRNDADALAILSRTYELLVNDGHHAEFLSLSERILNSIDWKKEEIGTSRKRAEFISQYLDILSLQEQSESKVEYYLKHYENVCEKNTIPYSGFLATKALVLWRQGKYVQAWQISHEYEEIYEKVKEAWDFSGMQNLKGMILRELDQIDDAIKVFNETSESSAKYGNIARCYQMNGKYDLAIETLKVCLRQLYDRDRLLMDNVNLGYACLWIAEIYHAMKKNDEAKKFLLLCQEIWKEYAPGLLSKTNDLMEKLGKIEIMLNPAEIHVMVKEFSEENKEISLIGTVE